jgi:aldehyde dehydrogenase (NAD+)
VKYGELLRENAEQIFWLEAILTGKARSFSSYEADAAAETFICKSDFPWFRKLLTIIDW